MLVLCRVLECSCRANCIKLAEVWLMHLWLTMQQKRFAGATGFSGSELQRWVLEERSWTRCRILGLLKVIDFKEILLTVGKSDQTAEVFHSIVHSRHIPESVFTFNEINTDNTIKVSRADNIGQ